MNNIDSINNMDDIDDANNMNNTNNMNNANNINKLKIEQEKTFNTIKNMTKNYYNNINKLSSLEIEEDNKNKVINDNTDAIRKQNTVLYKYKNELLKQNKGLENFLRESKKRTEKRVAIVIAVYSKDTKIYVGCHIDNTDKHQRKGKLQSCGGHVEFDEDFIQGAIREASEEHGLLINDRSKLQYISEHYNEIFNARYKYYGVDVTPNDYYSELITTPDEIIMDDENINNMLRNFPVESIIRTSVKSTFLVDIDILRDNKYRQYIYGPFHNFLKKTR